MRKRYLIGFVLGFGLIVLAQYLIAQPDPLIRLPLVASLSDFFYLDLVSPDNVFLSLILLLVGGLCVGWGMVRLPIFEQAADSSTPPRITRKNVWMLVAATILFIILAIRLRALDSNLLLVFVWVVILILLISACYRSDRHAEIPLTVGLKRIDIALIIGICGLGLLIGTFKLDWFPNSFVPDESEQVVEIRAIVSGEHTPSFFEIGPDSFPIPASYIQAAIYNVFGQSLWSWRFASVLPAILAVIPTYLLALALFDRRVAGLAGVIMVATPYFVTFERLGYIASQSIFPVTMCFYFLYVGLQRRSAFYIALGGTIGGLGFYTYFAARLGLVVGLAFLLLIIVIKWATRQQVRRSIALTGVFLITALAAALPVIIYQSAKDPELAQAKMLNTLFPNTVYAGQLFGSRAIYRDVGPVVYHGDAYFYRPDLYAVLLIRGVVHSLLAFHTSTGLLYNHFMAAPFPGPVAVIFFFVGLCFVFTRIKEARVLLLLVWFAIGIFLLSAINTFPPRDVHQVPLIPAISILTALGVVVCVDMVSQRFRSARVLATFALTATALAIVIYADLENYFVVVPQRFQPMNSMNAIAFNAFHMEKPQNIVYISPNIGGLDLDWVHFIPPSMAYQQVHPVTFARNDYKMPNGQDITFFFAENDAGMILAILQTRYNNSVPVEASVVRDSDGKPVVIFWTYHRPKPLSF